MAKRRTRKERERAAQRRQPVVEVKAEEGGLSYSVAVASLAKEEAKSLPPSSDSGETRPAYDKDSGEAKENWVKKDLKRTLWLTGLAFSLELCVYWVIERGGLAKLTSLFASR